VSSDRAAAPAPAPPHHGAPENVRRRLMAVGLLAFFQLGLIQAAYGPAFISMQARHGIGVAEVGTSVGMSFFGGFFGVLASGVLLVHFGYKTLLLAATSLLTLGMATVGWAPVWAGVLTGAAIAGFGYGVVVVLYNFLFARAFAPRGAAAVNLVNAMFGVGAILMPSVVAGITAWQVGIAPARLALVPPYAFTLVALAGAIVFLALWRLPWYPNRPPRAAGGRGLAGVPLLSAGLLAGLLLVYVAGEVSIAAWAPTHLEGFVGAARAPLVVSLFWATMTVGRFAVALFGGRSDPAPLVLASVALALVGVSLAHVEGLAFLGYAVAGLGMGPIFPTVVVWVEQRFGDQTVRVAPVVLAAGNIGPVIGAPAIGVVIAATGSQAVPSVLAALLALLLVVAGAAFLDARRGAR
jgi:fucose permease